MLQVDSLVVTYGKVRAVQGVSLRVAPGEIVALIGPNGAGKTTILKSIMGFVRPAAGTISGPPGLAGPRRPYLVARAGISWVPEGNKIFRNMSVRENLALGVGPGRTLGPAELDHALASFPALAGRLDEPAGNLSGGQQQMLALARSLAARPKLLLLDEPSLGLAPRVVEEVFDAVVALNRNEGVAVLLVEQNAYQALAVAHRTYVLENGSVSLQGLSADLLRRDDVRHSYLGLGPARTGEQDAVAATV